MIKQHKINPYKPWRCNPCILKYCNKCLKIFPESGHNIDCDKCERGYHQSCTDLTDEEYNHLCSKADAKWHCKRCTTKYCGKCSLSTTYKTKTTCKLCSKVFHNKCAGVKNSNDNWTCRDCNSSIFPFFNLDNKTLETLSTINEKHTSKNIKSTFQFSDCCSVCDKKVGKLGIPCSSCKALIHCKCSNLRNANNTLHSFKGKWQCPTCIHQQYPFTDSDDKTLQDLSFNSNKDEVCHFTSEVPIDEKLKQVLTYSQRTSWHSYTHPSDNDNFTDETDTLFEDFKPNCHYYEVDQFRKTQSSWNQKSFSILHTNICSLQANIENLEDLLTDLSYDFKVIALTETWNPEKSKDRFTAKQLPGYHEYYGTTGSSSKGGCGFYIKDSLTSLPREDLDFKITENGQETETCWVELINTKSVNTLVGTVYRHPSKNNDQFFSNLKKTLKKVNRERKKVILCGDFNFNLLNFDQDDQVNTFLNTMIDCNLNPCITEPTRITNANKPSLVDNIFVNSFEQPTSGNILEHISYDHLPNFTVLNYVCSDKQIELKKRDDKKFTPKDFEKELIDPTFILEVLNAGNTNEAYDLYQNRYIQLLDKHAPLRKLTKKEKIFKKKPWLTNGLLTSINKKRAMFNKLRKHKLKNKDTHEIYQKYKQHRNCINTLKKISKMNFYKKYFETNYNNSKKVWKGINQLLNKQKKSHKDIFLEDNGLITDPKSVANRFNDYFINIADKLSSKIVNKNTRFQDYLKNPNKSKLLLNETTPDEIIKIINNLDPKKSSDIYGISPKYVISTRQSVAQVLTIIFNRSVREGNFPQAMKVAKIISLHKGDSVLMVKNYRPISLLPIFSKIFERLVYNRLVEFIEKNNILTQNQFGFQKGKSTENAITSIISQILDAREKKESSFCIFLDFAKAFDTVNHDILLEKLKFYGVKDEAQAWFKSYLTNRSQYTQVGSTLSDVGYIKHGVPQGSVLGPLLFLIYINDITESSMILKFYLFADDTTVFYSSKTNPETESILNRELSKVSDWLAANKLSLNVSKSNFLHFHFGNTTKETVKIEINNTAVEETDSTKYLGVYIDNKLNWKKHISITKTKLSKATGMIAKTRHFVTDTVLLNLYYSFFLSHINYNLLNWSTAENTNLDTIRKSVKAVIRLISFKNKYEHTDPLFKKLGILPFDLQVKHKQATFMWKLSRNLVLPPLSDVFCKNKHDPHKFVLPRATTDYRQRATTYSCVKLWNSELRESHRTITSLKVFNNKYKDHLLNSIV